MIICRCLCAATLLILLCSAQQAMDEPAVSVIKNYYNIQGVTSGELKAQMKQKGPKGFWAYAKWWVNWSGSCRISVKVTYTFPRWVNKKNAPKSLRDSWDRMIRQLWKHEKGHGRHGINAAKEIEKSRCTNPRQVIDKWVAQDKSFDLRTRHGRSQGVHLP